MRNKNTVYIAVRFKDKHEEYFETDSFSFDSGILTIKQDTVKCTLRLDLIMAIYIC